MDVPFIKFSFSIFIRVEKIFYFQCSSGFSKGNTPSAVLSFYKSLIRPVVPYASQI